MDDLSRNLARNLRALRELRGWSQERAGQAAQVPRATWSNLESGSANPTLAVLDAVARSFGVRLEELLAPPRAVARKLAGSSLPVRRPGGAEVRRLLPDPLPGTEIERMELAPGIRFAGVPHTAGSTEYLACERGRVLLTVAGEAFEVEPGDLVTFRGDQRHGYANVGDEPAVAYSVVLLVPEPSP